jgi:hypothetical protein
MSLQSNNNSYRDGYPHAPLEQIQMWPRDPREEEAKRRFPIHEPQTNTVAQLTWFNDGRPVPHRHPYRPPTGPPRWREEWLRQPDPEPWRLETHPTEIPDLPDAFRDIHSSIRAPFASDEWNELVNWRRRESERGILQYGHDHHLQRYIHWAENYRQEKFNEQRERVALAKQRRREERAESMRDVEVDLEGILNSHRYATSNRSPWVRSMKPYDSRR